MVNFLETAKQISAKKVHELAKKIKWKVKSLWNNEWYNKLNAIDKAIALSVDEFSLCIAVYDSKEKRDEGIQKLSQKYDLIEIELEQSTLKIMPRILEEIENISSPKSAIFVTGIEGINVETVFRNANENRESFYKLKTPVVMWCDSATFNRIIRVAPELRSWASNPL